MKNGLKKAMIAAVALCGIAAAFTACSKKQAEIQIDPALKEYDFNYGSTMPSNADVFMKIDGELSETAYENRNWFENYLSEDLDGTSAHIAVTTVTGEKGWYVAAKVYDTAIKYNGLLAATKTVRFLCITRFLPITATITRCGGYLWTRAECTARLLRIFRCLNTP